MARLDASLNPCIAQGKQSSEVSAGWYGAIEVLERARQEGLTGPGAQGGEGAQWQPYHAWLAGIVDARELAVDRGAQPAGCTGKSQDSLVVGVLLA